jgi:hypothetical protein
MSGGYSLGVLSRLIVVAVFSSSAIGQLVLPPPNTLTVGNTSYNTVTVNSGGNLTGVNLTVNPGGGQTGVKVTATLPGVATAVLTNTVNKSEQHRRGHRPGCQRLRGNTNVAGYGIADPSDQWGRGYGGVGRERRNNQSIEHDNGDRWWGG